jgi:hypothetical protein
LKIYEELLAGIISLANRETLAEVTDYRQKPHGHWPVKPLWRKVKEIMTAKDGGLLSCYPFEVSSPLAGSCIARRGDKNLYSSRERPKNCPSILYFIIRNLLPAAL